MNIADKFKQTYGEKYILPKCRERKCVLKDVSQKNYLIIDGDEFKETPSEKSVDCIIVDLIPNSDGEYRVILCELTSGSKLLSDTQAKFKSSGKLIIDALNDIEVSICKIDCLLLGKIKRNGKNIASKAFTPSLRIDGFKRPVHIQNENCGFSINDIGMSFAIEFKSCLI